MAFYVHHLGISREVIEKSKGEYKDGRVYRDRNFKPDVTDNGDEDVEFCVEKFLKWARATGVVATTSKRAVSKTRAKKKAKKREHPTLRGL